MTPERLGALAGLSQWDRALWLQGASVSGTVLIVPTSEQAGVLTRCYLPQFQSVLPGLTIRVERTLALKPTSSVLKRPYTGRASDDGRQSDLLSEP